MLSVRILILAAGLPLLAAGRAAADCAVDETASPAVTADEARLWARNSQRPDLASASKQGQCRIEKGLAADGPPCDGARPGAPSITVRNLLTNQAFRIYPDPVDGRYCTVRQAR